jgi:DNA uptake protein ComE-like DNA-binding protein
MTRVLPIAILALFLAGCAPSNTDTLQQRTADATAAAKRDAEAISKGVAEGLSRKGPVNINSATDKDLERLPGVTPQVADSIIAKRPYAATRDLVRKRAVTLAEYNQIKNQIVAQ